MRNRYRGYRVRSMRMPGWDYCSGGWYFVTIITELRTPHFGKLKSGRVFPSACTKICLECWDNISRRHPHVRTDEFIVMPDHVHGLLFVNTEYADPSTYYESRRGSTGMPVMSKNSLGSIVNHFKGEVSKRIRKELGIEFRWKPRFHDHVLRNSLDVVRAQHYIRHNPRIHSARIRRNRL